MPVVMHVSPMDVGIDVNGVVVLSGEIARFAKGVSLQPSVISQNSGCLNEGCEGGGGNNSHCGNIGCS